MVNHADGVWFNSSGNPLAAQRSGDEWLILVEDLPAMGHSQIEFRSAGHLGSDLGITPFKVTDAGITTPFYEIEWNAQGQLTRIYNKEAKREVLEKGVRGNVLQIFEDKPLAHDAWDIDLLYQEKMSEVIELKAISIKETGLLQAVIQFAWSYGDSTINQNLVLYAYNRRIDFETRVDWHQRQQLLKVAFPVAIRATEATFDIQFGNVKRPTHWNTSWDYARFESVGHQWADLSEHGYGVSLLNDCKYGYDVRNNVLRLSLLRSSIYPDYSADQREHDFTYSLYPHQGDWRAGETVKEAWSLNNPLTLVEGITDQNSFSLFHLSSANIMIDAVKKAEDYDAVIIRLHEFSGGREVFGLSSDYPIHAWQECDLMERPIGEKSAAPFISTNINPYEIKTYLVYFQI